MEKKFHYSDCLATIHESDTPLCEICTNDLCSSMDSQVRQAEQDAKEHRKFFEQFKQEDEPKQNTIILTAELAELEAEESALLAELKGVNDDITKIEAEITDAERGADIEEARMRIELQHLHAVDIVNADIESGSLHNDYLIKRINAIGQNRTLSTMFDIRTNAAIGTVNGFRLGSLPDEETVDWSEINASLGQLSLMMAGLAKRLDLTYADYDVVPFGLRSYVRLVDTIGFITLPLYSNTFKWNSRFDRGMVALINCSGQLERQIRQLDGDFKLPYVLELTAIQNGLGKSYSIK